MQNRILNLTDNPIFWEEAENTSIEAYDVVKERERENFSAFFTSNNKSRKARDSNGKLRYKRARSI